jgi:rhamnulokinase
MQAIALGHLASLEEGRQVVRNSFEVTSYEPLSRAGWDEAYHRLMSIIEQPG